MTKVGLQPHTYTWNSNWAKLPDGISTGYTHGVVIDAEGLVHVFNQSPHALLSFDPQGNFIRTWPKSDRFLGAHGMTLVTEGGNAGGTRTAGEAEGAQGSAGEQFLWLTDQKSCEVVKTTLDGETVLSIGRPQHPSYDGPNAKYAPTWAAASPVDGTVFVADGYGSGFVSRYDRDGHYIDSFDGSDGAGRFKCPHGIWIGTRPSATGTNDPVLYVTDRGNARVQVFDLQGRFIKVFDQRCPCCFDQFNGGLLVPDLHAAVAIYDEQDQIIVTLGENRQIVDEHGWPNVPHAMQVAGKFNSPHGGAFDAEGNIYIVEWIEDGRVTKLTRAG